MATADGLLIVPEDVDGFDVGDVARVIRLDEVEHIEEMGY
jgi:hypothetical protein